MSRTVTTPWYAIVRDPLETQSKKDPPENELVELSLNDAEIKIQPWLFRRQRVEESVLLGLKTKARQAQKTTTKVLTWKNL